jgi:hypothetical protein
MSSVAPPGLGDMMGDRLPTTGSIRHLTDSTRGYSPVALAGCSCGHRVDGHQAVERG